MVYITLIQGGYYSIADPDQVMWRNYFQENVESSKFFCACGLATQNIKIENFKLRTNCKTGNSNNEMNLETGGVNRSRSIGWSIKQSRTVQWLHYFIHRDHL
jgi:hypothetical protein